MVDRGAVEAAARRIDGHVRRTPSVEVAPGVWFKLELLQHSGSFKARGAFNRILAAREAGELPAAGVVAASGGNAGLAVAFAAARLGIPAEVFVPRVAPAVKVRRLRELGAVVHQHGREYAEAYAASTIRVAETGALFVHAYDQPEIVAGQGTLALELPDVDTVLVATGGGGLVGGIAAAVGDRVRVVAVEPVGAPTLHAALAAGHPVDVAVDSVAADSLGARRVGTIGFAAAVATGCGACSWTTTRSSGPEGGCGRSTGSWSSSARRPRSPRWSTSRTGAGGAGRVAVVLCGANTDPADLTGDASAETVQDLSQGV